MVPLVQIVSLVSIWIIRLLGVLCPLMVAFVSVVSILVLLVIVLPIVFRVRWAIIWYRLLIHALLVIIYKHIVQNVHLQPASIALSDILYRHLILV